MSQEWHFVGERIYIIYIQAYNERLKLSPHESYSLDAGACYLKMTNEGTHTL